MPYHCELCFPPFVFRDFDQSKGLNEARRAELVDFGCKKA